MTAPAWANPDTKKLTRLSGTGEDEGEINVKAVYGPGVLRNQGPEALKAQADVTSDDVTAVLQKVRDLRQRVAKQRDLAADRALRVLCTAEYARTGGPRKKVIDLLRKHGYTREESAHDGEGQPLTGETP